MSRTEDDVLTMTAHPCERDRLQPCHRCAQNLDSPTLQTHLHRERHQQRIQCDPLVHRHVRAHLQHRPDIFDHLSVFTRQCSLGSDDSGTLHQVQ